MRQFCLPGFLEDEWSDSQLHDKIKHSGLLFAHLRFSERGIPPGTTEKILLRPEKYWRKKVDGDRIYWIPLGPLEKIHKRFAGYLENHDFLSCYQPASAYWKGSSIIKNAEQHRRNASSFCLDARKAFESIQTKHIYRYLLRTSRMLYGPHDTNNRAQAWIISRLLTCRGRLRLGSPASPFVFNLLFERLDEVLLEVLKNFHGVVYTRYADDFCFSAPTDVFPKEVEDAVRRVLREHHIGLKEEKTRRTGNGILEFPGVVVVRGRIRPNGEYVSKLLQRKEMSEIEREGHRNFLNQFKRKDVPRVVKAFLR